MVWVQNASPEVDAASNYPTIIAVCVSMTVLMMVVVSTRMYVRAVMIKMMGIDDWIVLFSAVCSVVYSGLCIGQSRWGLGLPVTLRPMVNLNQYSVINFSGRPFYMFGILGFKIALCLAYLRILSYSQRGYRFVIWCVIALCTMGHVAGTLVLLFQCNPVQKSWLPATAGYCLPNVPTFLGLALVTICFDVIIFFLPIPFLWKLNINNRRRGALIGMFLVGLFTTVCSILRMLRIFPLAVDGNSTMLVLWGTIELNVGVALTCVPALAPLFTYFRDHKSTKEYKKYQNSHELRSVETSSNKFADSKGRMDVSTKGIPASDDNESQTFILSSQTSLENQTSSRHEIQKTVEISVDTEQNPQPMSLQQMNHSKQKSEWLTKKY